MKVLMILSVATSVILFSTEPAQARPRPGSRAVYSQLQTLFENGELPANEDLVGWYAGRCYRSHLPNTPWNGLLTGWTTPGSDHGPIKPTRNILHTLPVYWANGAPGVFDRMSPQMEQSVARFVADQAPFIARARYENDTIYGSYTNRFDQVWALRMAPAAFFRNFEGSSLLEDEGQDQGQQDDGQEDLPQERPQRDARDKKPMPRQPAPGPAKEDDGEELPPEQAPRYIIGQMSMNGTVIQYCYYFKEVHTQDDSSPEEFPEGGQQ